MLTLILKETEITDCVLNAAPNLAHAALYTLIHYNQSLASCCLISWNFGRIAQSLLFTQCKVDRGRPNLARKVEVFQINTESGTNIQFVPHLLTSLGWGTYVQVPLRGPFEPRVHMRVSEYVLIIKNVAHHSPTTALFPILCRPTYPYSNRPGSCQTSNLLQTLLHHDNLR
jgi:hypothetical protein